MSSGKVWFDIKTRKEFFMKFAKERGFDPLIADNWYSVSNDDLVSTKVLCPYLFWHSNIY